MKKSDLQSGMIVKLRKAGNYLVLKNSNGEWLLNRTGFMLLNEYTENLKYDQELYNTSKSDWDIVEVHKFQAGYGLKHFIYDTNPNEPLWVENQPKPMTIHEIEEELGHRIKIIGEECP